MTIKEFFEIDFNDFEEIKIYKDTDTDDNLITHSCYCTETIIEKYGFLAKLQKSRNLEPNKNKLYFYSLLMLITELLL